MKSSIIFLALVLIMSHHILAQEPDLLKEIDDDPPVKEHVTNAFKSSRVINGHSMEFIGKGVLDFRILHRFGRINQGAGELFGMDQASMRMGFDYGLSKNLTIGAGRSTLRKELDGFIKFRPVWQTSGGVPFSIVLVSGITVNTLKNTTPGKSIDLSDRTGYYMQLIFGRKFSSKFSLQIAPTLVHKNIVAAPDDNDIYAAGVGARYKLSKRVALVVDYFYVVNGPDKPLNYNPLSVGFDFETGGHVFQLHFTNASGMNERAFITETTSSWSKGDIHFGFNLSRVFSIRKH